MRLAPTVPSALPAGAAPAEPGAAVADPHFQAPKCGIHARARSRDPNYQTMAAVAGDVFNVPKEMALVVPVPVGGTPPAVSPKPPSAENAVAAKPSGTNVAAVQAVADPHFQAPKCGIHARARSRDPNYQTMAAVAGDVFNQPKEMPLIQVVPVGGTPPAVTPLKAPSAEAPKKIPSAEKPADPNLVALGALGGGAVADPHFQAPKCGIHARARSRDPNYQTMAAVAGDVFNQPKEMPLMQVVPVGGTPPAVTPPKPASAENAAAAKPSGTNVAAVQAVADPHFQAPKCGIHARARSRDPNYQTMAAVAGDVFNQPKEMPLIQVVPVGGTPPVVTPPKPASAENAAAAKPSGINVAAVQAVADPHFQAPKCGIHARARSRDPNYQTMAAVAGDVFNQPKEMPLIQVVPVGGTPPAVSPKPPSAENAVAAKPSGTNVAAAVVDPHFQAPKCGIHARARSRDPNYMTMAAVGGNVFGDDKKGAAPPKNLY